jgi:subfamily B ATP-binding cassette protein MsbA
MSTFLRMVRYLRPYWRRTLLTTVCIGLYALLSGLSVLSVSPFVRILFEPRAEVQAGGAPDGRGATGGLPLPAGLRGLQTQARDWMEAQFLAGDRGAALRRFCGLIIGLFLLKNIFDYLQSYLIFHLEQRALRDVRSDLYRHLSHLPLGTYVRQRAGSFISPMVNDVALMRTAIVGGPTSLLRNGLMILLALGIILAASWKLALLALLVLPPNALLIAKLGRRLRRTSSRAQARMADMTSVVQETVAGARVVKAFGMHDFEQQRFERFNFDYFRASLRMKRLAALAAPISEMLAVVGLVAVLGYGGGLVLRGALRADQLFLFLTAMLWLAEPIKALIGLNNTLQEGLAAGERVFALLDLPAEAPLERGAPARFERELRFEKVSFGYAPDRPVLRDVDLVVHPGQIVALVGPSGAGKSTFVDLIPRFYEAGSGRILLDGIDVRDLSLESLRRLMGIVTQEVILFNDSVRANIAYGCPDVLDERIVAAARAANAHDFIARLPQGYDTPIGERGIALSGGERQRLSIARAILRDPRILVFDEATSSLDTESEQLIQEAIDRLMRQRTAFVIAHRLSTIQHADTILVIEDGRIVERGTHRELLAAAGTYAKLHGYQFR